MITTEKNRRRGKTNSVQLDIDEHIEWLKKRLKEIESQISKEIAVNDNWKQKMKVREGEVASPSLITLLDLLTSVPGIGEVVAVTQTRAFPSALKMRGVARQFLPCPNWVQSLINQSPI